MKTTCPHRRYGHSARNRHRARRGAAVGILVASLVIIAGLVAVTWGVANLSLTQRQLQSACEAAALAGAAELMDDDVLYGRLNPSDDVAAARAICQAYASVNPSYGQPTLLDLNQGNDPRGDVVIGYVPNPRWVKTPLDVWQGKGPANSIWVKASRSRLRGNPVSLWLGGLLGVGTGDVAAAARASLDHRVYGFRPELHTSVPLVPLAAASQAWHDQAGAEATEGENDNFTVDYRRGYVFDGGDGIPEIIIRANLPGGAGSASQEDSEQNDKFLSLVLSNNSFNESVRQRETATGLRREDLAQLGGEFSLGYDGTLMLPAVDTLDGSWCDVLWSIRGSIRVWPLGSAAKLANDDPGCQVTGYGAAVVVHTKIDDTVEPAQLVVTLQPALLATSTALTRDNAAENPWIAKLSLTE